MSHNKIVSTSDQKPIAQKIPTILEKHGHQRIDNYYWMRLSDDQKTAPNPDEHTQQVLDYLNAENRYRQKYWSNLQEFENKLFDEIVGRIKQTDMSVPYKNRGYWYINRFEEGKEYVIRSRKKESLNAIEEILLDENELAKDKAYFNTTGHTISTNNNLLAYGEDTVSRRQYKIRIKDLAKNIYLPDEIKDTSGNIVWA
ncbi:MAG TPA: oligopeptidase B, partial [Saprospiraceae bacterium]|nr:oligopeptidase B [Saprospiraceae bacterium]